MSDGPRPPVTEMSRSRKPILHLLLDIPSQPNVHLVASSHGAGLIVGGYRKVAPMIKTYKCFLHMVAGVNVTRAIFKSEHTFGACDQEALTVPEIITEFVHDDPPYVQFSACIDPGVTHALEDYEPNTHSLVGVPKKSFIVRTVNNPACKWVGIYTSTDQCLIVKHTHISPTALNWRAIAFPATITFELTSDFDIRGPPAAQGTFRNVAHLGALTHGFDGFVQKFL